MSQTTFKISESLNIKGLVLDNNSGTLTWNGSNLATQGYVDDAVANISVPPAYITSVGTHLAVDGSGNLTVDLSSYLTSSTASSTYATKNNASFTGTFSAPTGTITSAMIADGTIVDGDISSSAAIAQSKISGLASSFSSKADLASPTFTGTVVLPSSTSIGTTSSTELGYVHGVTSSIQTQLDAKLTSSAAASTYLTQSNAASTYATPANITTAINNLVNGAPAALDTLKELADAINDDASYASTITTALGNKAPLSGPTFTGTVVLPSSTSIGTTSSTELGYVHGVTSSIQTQINGKQNTLTAGNGVTIVSDTISLDPNVVITAVSLTDADSGVTASSDVFGNTTNTTYAKGSNVTVGTLATGTVAADIFVQILDNSGNSRTSKLTAVFNGSSAPIWTEYGIVDSGTTLATTISFDSSRNIIVNVTGSGTYAVRGVVTDLK